MSTWLADVLVEVSEITRIVFTCYRWHLIVQQKLTNCPRMCQEVSIYLGSLSNKIPLDENCNCRNYVERIVAQFKENINHMPNVLNTFFSLARAKSLNQEQEHTHNALYLSTCNAVLFLRLICPAIISPIEYGVLRTATPKKHVDEVKSNSLGMDTYIPTLWLLSHILIEAPGVDTLLDKDEVTCLMEISNVSYEKVLL